VSEQDIQITDTGLGIKYGANYGATAGGSSYSTQPRRSFQQQFSAAYVTGEHAFKAGVALREAINGDLSKFGHDLYMANTAIAYQFNNQRPTQLTLFATPQHYEDHIMDTALYAQDQWNVTSKTTLNLGIRYNNVNASSPDTTLPAGFFVPQRFFPAAEEIPHWRNLDPRMGAAHDIFGNGKSAVKLSLGR
jgi:outer membrane receptor protein involved in Fe transport